MIHMKGARQRLEREDADRRALAWMTAFLPSVKEPPGFVEFVTGKRDRAAWEAERERKWQAFDRALAANKNRKGA
jgi:hypothetical protein